MFKSNGAIAKFLQPLPQVNTSDVTVYNSKAHVTVSDSDDKKKEKDWPKQKD